MFASIDVIAARLDKEEISIARVLGSLNQTCLLQFERGFPVSALAEYANDGADAILHLPPTITTLQPVGLSATLLRGLQGKLLLHEIKHRGIDMPAHSVQLASDAARQRLGLTSVEATQQWLTTNGLTLDDWGEAVEAALGIDVLRVQLFGDQLETWFAQNQRRLDQVEIARLHVAEMGVGEEMIDQLVEQEISFAEAAARSGVNPDERKRAGYLGWQHRDAVPHGIEASLFDTNGPEYIGPIETESGVVIYRVLTRQPAQFDDDTQRNIANHLFAEWWQQQQPRIELLV